MQEEYTVSRVGERLRDAVKARGQSLKAYAEEVQIPYRSFQDYVGGKSKPGFEQMQKIARSGIDMGYILTGTETLNYLSDIQDEIRSSSVLAANEELASLLIYNLPNTIDDAARHVPIEYFLGSATRITIVLWHEAVALTVETVDELSGNLSQLKEQGVQLLTISEVILEAVGRKLNKKASKHEIRYD